jgi:hypothetical protein
MLRQRNIWYQLSAAVGGSLDAMEKGISVLGQVKFVMKGGQVFRKRNEVTDSERLSIIVS